MSKMQKLAQEAVKRLTGEEVTTGPESEAPAPEKPPVAVVPEAADPPAPERGQEDTQPDDPERDPADAQPDPDSPERDPSDDPPTDASPDQEAAEDAGVDAEDPKPRHKLPRAVLWGGIALAVVVVLAAIWCFIPKGNSGLDLLAVTTLKTTNNVSGYGAMAGEIDLDRLAALIADKRFPLPDGETGETAAETIIQGTDILFSPAEGLSNGDVVDVTVQPGAEVVQAYPALRLKTQETTYTVEGLTEGTLIDPFSPSVMTLRVEGNSGAAKAYLDIVGTGSYIYYLNYSWEPKEHIKNGDTITVTIDPATEKLAQLGYAIPEARTYEYPVGGLNEYVSDPKEIPDNYINSMVSYAEGEMARAFADVPIVEGQDIVVTPPEITSIYYLDKADKSTPYSDWFSQLQMSNAVAVLGHFFVQDVEPQETTLEDGTTTTQDAVVNTYGGYYVWLFPDVVRRPGGDYGYNQAMITTRPTSYQTESDCLAWVQKEFKGFAVTTIGSNNE